MKKKKFLKIIISILVLLILIILYSYFFGNGGLKVKEYKIVNKNIPNEFYGLKIVHISDIHYNKNFNKKDLEKVIKKINEINPDILFLTGDLVDSNIDENKTIELQNLLSNIKVNIKKYAIKGNHDYDFEKWEEIIKASNFINLNDTYDVLYSKESQILISGISTNLHGNKTINEKIDSTLKYLENNTPNYKILLIHEPDYIDKIDTNDHDLILAGHSHNGQITLPIIGAIYKPTGAKKYYKNYYKINNSDLFVSSGLGTSIVPFRLFNKPSINFYRLTNK